MVWGFVFGGGYRCLPFFSLVWPSRYLFLWRSACCVSAIRYQSYIFLVQCRLVYSHIMDTHYFIKPSVLHSNCGSYEKKPQFKVGERSWQNSWELWTFKSTCIHVYRNLFIYNQDTNSLHYSLFADQLALGHLSGKTTCHHPGAWVDGLSNTVSIMIQLSNGNKIQNPDMNHEVRIDWFKEGILKSALKKSLLKPGWSFFDSPPPPKKN